MRFIKLINNQVISVRNAENIIDGEIESELGELNQILLEDGSFVYPPEYYGLKLEQIKELTKSEFNQMCEKEIVSGFELELSNGLHHYDFDRDTQLNMLGRQSKITLMMGIGTPLESISWYYTNGECEEYSITDFLTLCNYGEQFKTALIEKCKTLKARVNGCVNQEEIELIVW